MSDKEEEYQFAGDEVSADSSTEESSQAYSSSSSTVNPELSERAKRLTLVVVIIITGFVVYHFWGGKKTTAEEQPIVPTAEVAQPQEQPPVADASEATPEMAAEQQTPSPASDELSKQVAELRQNLMADDSRVHHLEVAVTQVEQSMANIDDAISDMRLQVQAMMKKMQLLEKQMLKPKVKKIANRRPVIRRPQKMYALTAVIRGRAWVSDDQGHELTVKVGDTIPGYGMVHLIDPKQGMVTTSSGRIITYGQDDA